MNSVKSILFGLLAASTVGCGPSGPYEVGLIVKSTAEVSTTTTSYREVGGKGVQESVGAVGSGTVCSDAMSSAGTRVTQWLGEDKVNMQVVGETQVPRLVPDDTHEQEDVWISLVMETTRSAGTAYSSESTNSPDSDPSDRATESLEDRPITTGVRYFGVTADDYVAAFELATLWPSGSDGLDPADAQLLTKNDPKKGDVWFSKNGNSVYMFSGNEELSISGQTLKVAKVMVYEASDVEFADEGIMDDCINKGREQYSDSGSDDDYDDEVALLDAGCGNGFRHTQTGSQWWYNGILVKEETENVDVNVVDYGWEWYEESGSYCTRQTSLNRPDDEAKKFIQYEVSVSTVNRMATDWIAAP